MSPQTMATDAEERDADEALEEHTEETSDVDTATDDDGGDRTTPASHTSGSSRLPWLVALVAGAAAVVFALLWWSASQEASDTQAEMEQVLVRQEQLAQTEAAAEQVISTLTSWNAAEGLQSTVDALREQATGPFAEEVEGFQDQIDLVGEGMSEPVGGLDFGALQEAGVQAQSEVTHVMAQSLGDGVAEVFVIARVEYSTQEDASFMRAQVNLEQVDGTWKVHSVQTDIGLIRSLMPDPIEGG